MSTLQRRLALLLVGTLTLLLGVGWLAFVRLSAGLQPQKPRSKPVPGYALLRVTPADALVKVDGKTLKPGTKGLSLPVGKHRFSATAVGHRSLTKEITIHSDDAALVRLRLVPHPVLVRVESTPSGAQLFLNGRPLGRTPLQTKLAPGWFQLKLQKKGFVEVSQNSKVQPRQENFFHMRMGGARRLRGKDKMPQRWIPGSLFPRGSNRKHTRTAQALCQKHSKRKRCPALWFSFERPRRLVRLNGYWIDEREVSRAQYKACVLAKQCPPSLYTRKDQRKPVNGISWTAAQTYCRWAGGRLPTEAEWELAARGTGGRQFPWGQRWEPSFSNHGLFRFGSSLPDSSDGYRQEAPVGSYPRGRSPYHVLDMAGNLQEWVKDCFHGTFYVRSKETNPVFFEKNCFSHVIRGGSWMSPAWELRTTHRLSMPSNARATHVGFRCAQDADD